MAVEEKSVKKHLKSMKKELESSAAHEDAIDVAEKKLQTYITDELNHEKENALFLKHVMRSCNALKYHILIIDNFFTILV